jgi:hypothetical protein
MVLLLLVLTTSSCAAAVESDQRQPTFLPTLPPSNVWPTALLLGRLAERDGCVLLRAGRTWVLLLWPDGYTAEQGGDSGLRVLDENGKLVAAVGDRVRLGGGHVGESQNRAFRAEDLIGEEILARCRADAYAVTSGPA